MFPLSVVESNEPETTKTSHAEITLKSATLPRRKPTKMEIQVEVKPKVSVTSCRAMLYRQLKFLCLECAG